MVVKFLAKNGQVPQPRTEGMELLLLDVVPNSAGLVEALTTTILQTGRSSLRAKTNSVNIRKLSDF